MIPRPTRSTRTYVSFPFPTVFRSVKVPGPAGLGSALRGAGGGGDEQIGDAVTVVGQGLAAQALDDDKVACLATQPPEVRGKVIPLRERVCMGQVGDDDVAGLRSGLKSLDLLRQPAGAVDAQNRKAGAGHQEIGRAHV